MRLFSKNILLNNTKTSKAWREASEVSELQSILPSMVTYGNGVFLACGVLPFPSMNYLGFSTSEDGINWDEPYIVTSPTIYTDKGSMAYGNNKFVIVGKDSSGKVYSSVSSDGENWSSPSLIDYLAQSGGVGLLFDGTRFVATSNSFLYQSTDGTNWQTIQWPTQFGADIERFAYGDNKYVAVAQSLPSIYVSTNLTNWTKHDLEFDNYPWGFQDIIYDGAKFIAIPNNNSSVSVKSTITSKDGVSWTDPYVDSHLDMPGGNFCRFAKNDIKLLLLGGIGYISTRRV